MAELEWPGRPERASLRRALRHTIRRNRPELRVIAEDFLAEATRIDLLAVGPEGELVSLRIGDEQAEATLFTRALADLSWLRPRALDLLKLAPGLGLETSTEPRAMVFCPRFSAETRAAAENLPTCSLELLEYRCLRQQGQLTLLLIGPDRREPTAREASRVASVDPQSEQPRVPPRQGPPEAPSSAAPAPSAQATDLPPRRLTDPPSPSTFRTGLTDADLRAGKVGELASS